MCVVFELAELQVTAAARASKCSPADGEAAGRHKTQTYIVDAIPAQPEGWLMGI